MEANPHAINLGGDDEYTVTKPNRGPPPLASRQIVPMNSTSSLITENPHAISLNSNDYPSTPAYTTTNTSTTDEYGQTHAPRDKTKLGKMTPKVCTAKVLICAFAIGFLWLTTFGVAQGFVNAVIETDVTPEQVLDSWNATFYDSRKVKDNFEICIEAKNGVCQDQLNVTTLNELERGMDIKFDSTEKIRKAQDILAACQEKAQKKHRAIDLWIGALQLANKQWRTTDNCKNNALYTNFLKIGQGNTTQNADAQARTLTKQYQAALGQLADNTRDAFKVRAAYNAQWASNHTPSLLKDLSLNATRIPLPNLTLSQAFAVLSPTDLQGLTDIKNKLGPELNNSWNTLVQTFANAKVQAEKMKETTDEYNRQFSAQVVKMNAYVDTTQIWLKDAKATVVSVTGKCDNCDFASLPDLGVSYDIGFPALGNITMTGFNISTAAFDANLNNKLAAYKDLAAQKASMASEAMKNYFANLDTRPDWAGCIPCDYNPPPLLFPSEEEQDASDAGFNAQLNGLLTNLGDAADNAQVGAEKAINNSDFSLPSLEFIQAQRSKADLPFANLSGDPDFTNILAGLASISSMLLGLDYVYRAFRSLTLVVRYWFGSAVGLPDIKINKQHSAEVKEPIGVRIMTFITSPAFVLLLVGLIVFGLVYVLMDLYVPIVKEYAEGCKSSENENGPGTLISRNAYSLVYNNAVGPGQKTMQKHLTDYDTMRQNVCGQYVSQTNTQQTQLQSLLDQTLAAYKQTYEELQTMNQCMSVDTNNYNFFEQTDSDGKNFNDATGKIIPFNMTSGSQTTWNDNTPRCSENELAPYSFLEDMTFVCGNVSLCERMGECTASIDTPVLRLGSWKSSCESEEIVLMGITAAGFSIFVYIMWNVGRTLLVMGLARLMWRHLVPHGFNYIATCNTDGRIARDTEKEVKDRLAVVITRFERWGIIYLAFAVFLQLIWIIPMIVFMAIAK